MNHLAAFEKYFGIQPSGDRYHHYECPACGGDMGRSGVISNAYPITKCFQPNCPSHSWAETKSGWVLATTFLMNVQGMSMDSIRKELRTLPSIKLPRMRAVRGSTGTISIPDVAIPIIHGEGLIADKARLELTRRGLDVEEMWDMFRIRYIREAGHQYYGRLIVPFYTHTGKFWYYQGRDFLGYQDRWKNPNTSDFGVGKSELIYNAQILPWAKDFWLHEGGGDVWATIRSIGILGTQLSTYQYRYIISSPASEVKVCLDEDAWIKTLKICESLLIWGTDKFIKAVPILPGESDAGDVGAARLEDRSGYVPPLTLDMIDRLINHAVQHKYTTLPTIDILKHFN